MAERDAQMLAAANTVHRQHAGQVRALLAAARAEGCGFIGGSGGRDLIESTEAVIRALEALSGLLCQEAPPLEEVLAQLLELAWDAVRASAASVRVLRSAALAGGTWADPGPSEVATARVCVQAHRAHQRLVEDGAQLLRYHVQFIRARQDLAPELRRAVRPRLGPRHCTQLLRV